MEYRAPVTCRQELQWHAHASSGSLEAGMVAVNVWALQRQCAVSVTVESLDAISEAMIKLTEGNSTNGIWIFMYQYRCLVFAEGAQRGYITQFVPHPN